jgi:hypothetical protein
VRRWCEGLVADVVLDNFAIYLLAVFLALTLNFSAIFK